MKKQLLITFVFLSPFFGMAQRYTNKEKAVIAAAVDSLVVQYNQKNTLVEAGASGQSIRIIKEFKGLFLPNAIIFDDINAEFKPEEQLFPYVLRNKSLFEYIDQLVDQFPDGLTIQTHNVRISYDEIEKGEVDVYLARTISGKKASGQYNLSNEDTLHLTLVITQEKSVKIASIAEVSMSLKVQNDDDLDGVINEIDECVDQKGSLDFKGCPDDDGDGIPNRIDDCPELKGAVSNKGCPGNNFAYNLVVSASAGYAMYQTNFSELTSGFGYDRLDLSQEGTGSKIENAGFSTGPCLNAHIGYFFGKKNARKNKGLSLGINYGTFDTEIDVGNTKYFFVSKDGGNNEYWRIVTLRHGSKEEVSYTMMNVSLMFRIKTKMGNRLAVEFGLGPSYINYTAQSAFAGSIDYEGIYQYDENTGSLLTSGLSHYTYNTHDWLLVHDEIQPNAFDPSTDILFQKLRDANINYDFILNSSPANKGKKSKADSRSGLGLNAVLDFYYHIKPRIALKVGFGFIYSSLGNNKSKAYVSADKSNGEYNSILNSSAKSTHMSIGGNIGLLIGFGIGGK